ncbi:MAG: asparagine synthase C-terminal domain-containing protein [Prevotellaceae bacterium]|jgi:asparagine synthase (glutamine-hydrolysing)|nr:asparagine synthase C-terminal domain-containing protein [Prevotellaceae bacterium]
MIQLKLEYSGWYRNDFLAVKGFCFDKENRLFIGEELLDFFADIHTKEDFAKKLKEANGIFSVVVYQPDFKAVSIDRTRIFPLFYRQNDHDFIVTDNPYSLLQSDDHISLAAEEEYHHISIVLGNKTLVENIFQVRPSSFIVIFDDKIEAFDYVDFLLEEKDEIEKKNAEKLIVSAFENGIKRLISSTKGRQLVVPLSGGYDSRLIACLLKLHDCENVLCYNVGRRGNPEHQLSQQVAEKLGFSYFFIDNADSEFLSDYIQSADFQRYYRYSGNLSSSFWMYEYFGVKYLKERCLIADDAVFIPGHSGDFLGGSQFSKAGVKRSETSKEIVKKLLQNKFSLGDKKIGKQVEEFVREFVTRSFKKATNPLPYSVFENFDYKEKLPKFINNSVRIYEFFGYETRLFFWDNEVVDVFRRLPYQLRLNKNFYDKLLENNYFIPLQLLFARELKVSKLAMKWQQIKNRAKRLLPAFVTKRINRSTDNTCMKEISAPLQNELQENGQIVRGQYNKVFNRWYIMKLKSEL